jgi:hypothetical protein
MKKLILVIAALALVASPALAVDWNFYGSSRVQTWYTSIDGGDGGVDDADLQWGTGNGLANNSRFGARVKAENLSGRVEVQMKATSGGDPGSSITTESRLLYGEWKFGAGTLLVGKAYTPVAQFISGQAYNEDLGLLAAGTAYGQRISQLALSFGGFTVALVEPRTELLSNMSSAATVDAPATTALPTFIVRSTNPAFTGGDTDAVLPKIEAKWGMSFDMFSFNVMGGLQYYEIEDVTSAAGTNEDVDVTSYIVGGDVAFNFGPAYIKGAISAGVNWADAAWDIPGLSTGGSFAAYDGDDDIKDTDSWQGALVGGFKFTDQMTFEAGLGYRSDDPDLPGAEEDEVMTIYGQAVIALAPGVWLVPEVGFIDFMDDAAGDDEGDQIYLGAKWQIDF